MKAEDPWKRACRVLKSSCGYLIALLVAIVALFVGLQQAVVLRHGRGLDIPESLEGRNVLITGSTSGIGFGAAIHACDMGAHLFVHGPNPKRTREAAARLRDEYSCPGGAVPVSADLGDFSAVRELAAQVRSRVKKLHILILNAGYQYKPPPSAAYHEEKVNLLPVEAFISKSGHDRVMAINHLGHFLLTVQLAPILAANGAVVVMGSHAMWHSKYEWLMPPQRLKWEAFSSERFYIQRNRSHTAYQASKLANLCFSRALRRRFRAAGRSIRVTLNDPGEVRSTMSTTRQSKRYRLRLYLEEPFPWYMWWDWRAPTLVGGRCLLDSAFVTSPEPDVCVSFFFPSWLLTWYARSDMVLFRMSWGQISNVFQRAERFLFYGSLHASLGPECNGEVFEDSFWRWSANATGIRSTNLGEVADGELHVAEARVAPAGEAAGGKGRSVEPNGGKGRSAAIQ